MVDPAVCEKAEEEISVRFNIRVDQKAWDFIGRDFFAVLTGAGYGYHIRNS